MDRQYGKNRQGIWKNLRLKYNNEEEEEFDADEEMGEEIAMNEI